MIQLVAACLVCAAVTRFVFLSMSGDEEVVEPGIEFSLTDLSAKANYEMSLAEKPEFVALTSGSDSLVEVPEDYKPLRRMTVIPASVRDLVFCRAQESDAIGSSLSTLSFLTCSTTCDEASDDEGEGPLFGQSMERCEDAAAAADQDASQRCVDDDPDTSDEPSSEETKRELPPNDGAPWPKPRDTGELCTICYEHSADAAVLPCGHVGLCYKCAIGIYIRSTPCAFCRCNIAQIVTIDRRYPLFNARGRTLFRVTGPGQVASLDENPK